MSSTCTSASRRFRQRRLRPHRSRTASALRYASVSRRAACWLPPQSAVPPLPTPASRGSSCLHPLASSPGLRGAFAAASTYLASSALSPPSSSSSPSSSSTLIFLLAFPSSSLLFLLASSKQQSSLLLLVHLLRPPPPRPPFTPSSSSSTFLLLLFVLPHPTVCYNVYNAYTCRVCMPMYIAMYVHGMALPGTYTAP